MNTSSGHILTRLDYILVDTLHSSFDYQTDTFFACSDHLALRTVIYNRLTPTNNFFWRLNTSNLTIPHVRKHLFSLVNSLDLSPSLDAWESFKHQIRSYFEEQPVKRQNYWKKTDALNKEIIKLQKTLLLFPEADDLKKVISDKTSLRDSIAETLSEKWRIRSRSKWIEKGEKSSKYFYQRFKINSSDSFTEHLSKRHRYDQQSALDEAKDFYQNLYTPEPTDSSATQELLSSLPQVSKECSEKLLEPISYKDILKLLNQLPTFKAPGTDGLGYEFYKEFSAPLSRILANLFNNIISSGNLPLSWKLSNIVLIPKKSEDKGLIQNWRPIALINSDCKIFMKIIANRLNSLVLPKLIKNHQNGFCSSRNISDTTLDIQLALEQGAKQTSPSWMLFLDQQKAFDRVNHEYMINSLKAFGFSSSFCNIIQELYSDQLASVSDGRNISTLFKLGRGVRQGDPLSPLLYILTLEPFLNLVDRRIHGIKLSKISFKTKAYADDTTIGLSHNDWHPLNQAISLYQKASNAKINFNKSVLLPLNQAAKNSHFNSPISFKKAKDDEIIRSLGFSIRNGHFDYKDTWNYILKKMEKTVAKLEQRSLSIRGRVLVAKSLILSQMWYYIPIIPPNRKTKLTIYRLIQRFIRNSNLLPAYQSLCGHITWGGVAAPDINNSINATLAKYCLGCFTSRAPWAVQLRDTIELNIQKKQKKDLHQFLERNIKSISGWPGAWKPWIRAWRLMEGSFEDSFQSPHLQKEDLFLAGKVSSEYSIKKGRIFLSTKDHSLSLFQPFKGCNEISWFRLQSTFTDNKIKEISWKLLQNALPLGERIRYFADSSCLWCINTYQDRQHFLLDCPVAKKMWNAIENITSATISRSSWQTLCGHFINTKHQPSISTLTFQLAVYELHCLHSRKHFDPSFSLTFYHAENALKYRLRLAILSFLDSKKSRRNAKLAKQYKNLLSKINT